MTQPIVHELLGEEEEKGGLPDEVYVLPTSTAQQRFWLLDQLEPNNPALNMPLALRLVGQLDAGLLEASINEVVRRHEILRTTFAEIEGQLMQIISPSLSVSLPVTAIESMPVEEKKSESAWLTLEEARRPFSLTEGPLFRASLIRLSEQEHILLMTTHHITCDGWSNGVLVREVGAIYEAFSKGDSSPLPDLPIQFADYANWQQEWIRSEDFEEQLDYWKQCLSNLPILDIPTDRPGRDDRNAPGDIQSLLLPESLARDIRAFIANEDVTMFTLFLAVYKVLLYRYTGQKDIFVCSSNANRQMVETEPLIGPFANTMVLRTDFTGDPTFKEALGRVKDAVMGVLARHDVPFEKIVEQLHLDQGRGPRQKFQIMFTYQAAYMQPIELNGLMITPLRSVSGGAIFEMMQSVVERREGLRLQLEYNTDLYDLSTAQRLLGQFRTLVESAIKNPEARISELQILTQSEREKFLAAPASPNPDDPRGLLQGGLLQGGLLQGGLLQSAFERHARERAEATALECERERLSYKELNSRANRMAKYLRAQGVKPGDAVGVLLDRSADAYALMLAIMKAGGAYLPLDLNESHEPASFGSEKLAAQFCVTRSEMSSQLTGTSARVLCLDWDQHTISSESDSNPEINVTGASLAAILTNCTDQGTRERVLVTHETLMSRSRALAIEFGFSPEDRGAQLSPVSLLESLEEIFPLWLAGAAVIARRAQVPALDAGLQDWLSTQKITILNMPAALFASMADQLSKKAISITNSLRLVIAKGSRMSPVVFREWVELEGNQARLVNAYATAETVMTALIREPSAADSALIFEGFRPIALTEGYALDGNMQLALPGAYGELYIRGEGIGANCVPASFEEDARPGDNKWSGSNLLKTGHGGRYVRDAGIEIIEHAGQYPKANGISINPLLIEAALYEQSAAREALVILSNNKAGEARFTGYVTPQSGAVISPAETIERLKQVLPAHMVPSDILVLDRLPLTLSGRINQAALPKPEERAGKQAPVVVAPKDEIETLLIRIWKEVFGITGIGITDNFFSLGGTSLLAVRLFAQMEKVVKRKIPLATLAQAPTIEKLAMMLREDGWSPSWKSLVPLQPSGSKPPFFLAHAAGGNVIWYRDLTNRLGPDQPSYGLQAQGLDGSSPQHSSIEQMAAHYIKEIMEIDAEGPYFLGGASFGGLIAYEMARQLKAQRKEVALLALFDAWAPGYPRPLPNTTSLQVNFYEGIRRVQHYVTTIYLLPHEHRKKFIAQKAAKARYRIARFFRKQKRKVKSRLNAIGKDALPRALVQTQDAIADAARSYKPSAYDGHATLFRASKQPLGVHPDPTLGWGELITGELEIHEIPGYHDAMLYEPYLGFLIEKLSDGFERARMAVKPKAAAAGHFDTTRYMACLYAVMLFQMMAA